MNIEFYRPEDLGDTAIEAFWKKGINMDDWDYLFVIKASDIKMDEYLEDGEPTLEPVSYVVARLLTGCCNNKWYSVKFGRKWYYVGVAYHA